MASRGAGVYPPIPVPLAAPAVDTHTHLDLGLGVRGPIKAGEPAPEVDPADDGAEGSEQEGTGFPPLSFFHDAAQTAGITRIVQIGCEMSSARFTADLVARVAAGDEPGVRPDWMLGGVAIHPNEAPRLAAVGLLDDSLAEIEALLASHPRMRVVGETGMDFFQTEDAAGRRIQEESFRAHIEIAKRLGLALQIHDRNSHADVLRILADAGAPDVTIFHCFSGDEAMARECARRGYLMSFSGNITFKNAHDLRAAAAAVPDELLLTETDAPFLTPHPHRGKPGGSYLVPLTVRKLAEVRLGAEFPPPARKPAQPGQPGPTATPENVAKEAEVANLVTANAERALGGWALA